MDFNWSFFLTIAVTITSIISVVVILKYTGGLDIVIQLLRWLVDFFRQSVDWAVNNSPRPIRMLLVLFLIISIGAGIYAVTFGATKVCFEDQVYSVPWYEGIVFKLNPDVLFTEAETVQQLENFVWYNGSPVENYNFQVADHIIDQNVFYWNSLYQDGIQYQVLNLLAVGGVLHRRDDYGLISRQRPDVFWKEIWGKNYASYSICGSRRDNTCVLKDGQCQTFLRFGGDEHTWLLGRVFYTFEDFKTGELTSMVGVDIGGDFQSSSLAGTRSWCVNDPDLTQDFNEIYPNYAPVNVKFSTKRWFNVWGVREHDIWLYNAFYGPFFTIPCDSQGNCYYIDIQDVQYEALSLSVNKIRTNWQSSSSSLAGVIEFKCKEDSDNAYDTEMRVLGFNPFDPLTIGLVFLISLILYIYGAMFRFR